MSCLGHIATHLRRQRGRRMNTEKLKIMETAGTAVADIVSQQATTARYAAHPKLFKFLTDPEPPLLLQTVVLMIAIVVTCILIAIPA